MVRGQWKVKTKGRPGGRTKDGMREASGGRTQILKSMGRSRRVQQTTEPNPQFREHWTASRFSPGSGRTRWRALVQRDCKQTKDGTLDMAVRRVGLHGTPAPLAIVAKLVTWGLTGASTIATTSVHVSFLLRRGPPCSLFVPSGPDFFVLSAPAHIPSWRRRVCGMNAGSATSAG